MSKVIWKIDWNRIADVRWKMSISRRKKRLLEDERPSTSSYMMKARGEERVMTIVKKTTIGDADFSLRGLIGSCRSNRTNILRNEEEELIEVELRRRTDRQILRGRCREPRWRRWKFLDEDRHVSVLSSRSSFGLFTTISLSSLLISN